MFIRRRHGGCVHAGNPCAGGCRSIRRVWLHAGGRIGDHRGKRPFSSSGSIRKIRSSGLLIGVGGPAGSKKAAKRCTEASRRERLRTQARQGAASINGGPETLKKCHAQ